MKTDTVVKTWYAIQYAETAFWGATTSTLGFGLGRAAYTGNWKTFQTGLRMASFGVRAHANAVRGVLNTPLSTRPGAKTLGRATANFALAVGAGYAIGSVVGTGAAYAAFGDEGAILAADLYAPGGANFWDDGLMKMGDNLSTIVHHYS